MKLRFRHLAPLALSACMLALPGRAAEVTARVTVSGPKANAGSVGCSLFASPKGFPMDNSGAQAQWHPAEGSVTCRFTGLADGTYAIAASHDLNGNKAVDTNFMGIPTEAWGVSNNVRPTLRAPRFEEAAFRVGEGKDVALDIKVKP